MLKNYGELVLIYVENRMSPDYGGYGLLSGAISTGMTTADIAESDTGSDIGDVGGGNMGGGWRRLLKKIGWRVTPPTHDDIHKILFLQSKPDMGGH